MKKLNNLYVQYTQETVYDRKQLAFRELYEEAQPIRRQHQDAIVRGGYGDDADALEIFHDVILALISKAIINDFERALNSGLRKRRINLLRNMKRKRSRQSSLEQLTEVQETRSPNPQILRSDYDVENDVVGIKEADQRQLIDFLVSDPTKVDSVTTQIVTKFSEHNSIAALAKALGLHHEFVKRKLTALARHYDANRFGDDHREYFAV